MAAWLRIEVADATAAAAIVAAINVVCDQERHDEERLREVGQLLQTARDRGPIRVTQATIPL